MALTLNQKHTNVTDMIRVSDQNPDFDQMWCQSACQPFPTACLVYRL